MSRKIIDGHCVVRPNTNVPSPYLKQFAEILIPSCKDIKSCKAIDIGAGSGRNSAFLLEKGIKQIYALDLIRCDFDWSFPCDVGKDPFPIDEDEVGEIDVFLANYIFMFLNREERKHVIDEVKRVCSGHATIMVELYKAVDGVAKTDEEVAVLQQEIFDMLNWSKVHWSKGRFIATRYQDFS